MNYIYYTQKHTTKRNAGFYVIAKVYVVKRSKVKFVCNVDWNTASYKGDKSAIMNHLAEIGIIPKKYIHEYYVKKPNNLIITEI